MKLLIKIVVFALVIFLFTSTAFGVGVALGGSGLLFQPGVVRAADQPTEFDTFWQAWNVVHSHFVDRDALDATRLTYGAIRGMVQALGDEGHTTFLTPQDVARHRIGISGTFSGIGAQVGLEDGLPVIVAPFDGSPAEEAGIKAGDIIIEVDGEDVTAWPLGDIVEKIRGEAGTAVNITVVRPGEGESYEITVVRGEINSPNATWAIVPGTKVAVVRLSQFSADATDELTAAIREAEAAGATALIMDVRNNPGGLLAQAIRVTSQFLTDGNVLQQEDSEGNRKVFPVREGGIATDIPLVVLVNRGSASSSEIFAGALQDHKRALILGTTSFGKGSVQNVESLGGGYGLKLTIARYYTPNGRSIQAHGIEPAPLRGQRMPWRTFLKAHWQSIAATDFFTVEVVNFPHSAIDRYHGDWSAA